MHFELYGLKARTSVTSSPALGPVSEDEKEEGCRQWPALLEQIQVSMAHCEGFHVSLLVDETTAGAATCDEAHAEQPAQSEACRILGSVTRVLIAITLNSRPLLPSA